MTFLIIIQLILALLLIFFVLLQGSDNEGLGSRWWRWKPWRDDVGERIS